MEPRGIAGPVVVCLDAHHDPALLARCGIALARLWGVPLHLAAVVVVRAQRPLGDLSLDEERTANRLLDEVAEHATAAGLAPIEEIWAVRDWEEAVPRMAGELMASALVLGWRTAGPLGLLDVGRALLQAAPCPVLMVGQGRGRSGHTWAWNVEMAHALPNRRRATSP